MVVEVIVKGYFEENCYFYIDEKTKHGFLIDPGACAKELLNMIYENGWTIEKILLTHGHFDHMGAVSELRNALNIPVCAYETSDQYLLDGKMNLSVYCGQAILVRNVEYLKDGEMISLTGNQECFLKVIYTPGHTTDSIVYYSERDGVAFVGDTIFKGSIGSYQYPGGNREVIIESILKRILVLPKETILYSGHTEQTTVGIEQRRYGIVGK